MGALPPTTQVGLIAYGATTSSSAADKTKGCQDIHTLVPVAKLDAARITTAVNQVKASGYTPIGNALRAAAKTLPTEGPRSIVLVSDGEDTCAPPNPCDVAKELKKQGTDLTVHTVGFKVDPKARAQLSCIAKETGGTYADATTADQLTTALQTKTTQAITGYTTKGTKITGANQLSLKAPRLNPGQYLDTYAKGGRDDLASGPPGTTKYYTVPLMKDATVYVSATLVPPTKAASTGRFDAKSYGSRLVLHAQDGRTCGSNDGVTIVTSAHHDPATTVLVTDLASPSYNSHCPTDGVGILEVQRRGTAYQQQALPLEIVVRIEPPADTSGVPPAFAKAEPGLPQPTFGEPTPIDAGSSFNDAPTLASGNTYSDEIVTGEDRFYKVALRWGQRLTYAVKEIGPAQPQLESPVVAWTDFYNPMRQGVDMTQDNLGKQWFAGLGPDSFTGSTAVPVRYTNRTSWSNLRHYQLDGDYYLRLNADLNQQQSSTRYLVTVVVSGTPETGPTYHPTTTGRPTTATSPTAAAGQAAPTTAATPPAADGNTVAAQPASTDAGGPGTLVYLLIAAAVLGAAGSAVLVARARRAPPPDGTSSP